MPNDNIEEKKQSKPMFVKLLEPIIFRKECSARFTLFSKRPYSIIDHELSCGEAKEFLPELVDTNVEVLNMQLYYRTRFGEGRKKEPYFFHKGGLTPESAASKIVEFEGQKLS